MNIKEIKEMINLMNENNLTELEVEKGGSKIRLKKSPTGAVSMEPLHGKTVYAPAEAESRAAAVHPESRKETPVPKAPSSKTTEITAPMVGTFYRSPSPEAASFVEINQVIEVGQVLCIVEAMKLMNEIKSEIKGKIVDILVDNAEPVEFGQPLFLIEPA
jgi:acetyl-CoA carboxylase biotin carboxyl carrier protein